MNPTGAFWADLFIRLFVESSVLMALAAIVSRKLGPQQCRTSWQVALSALVLLFAFEATGLHRKTSTPPVESKPSRVSRQIIVEVMPAQEAVTPSVMQPAAQTGLNMLSWLPGLVWLAGVGWIAGRAFFSRIIFVTARHRRVVLNDPGMEQVLASVARAAGLRRRIVLTQSELLVGPIAFGFVRPCICVPKDFARKFRPAEVEAMLAHETAHLAVHDPFWYAVTDLALAVFWFNPFVWFGRRQFQNASECAADEASLLVRDGAATLATCLVQIGKQFAETNSYGWIGIEGDRFRSALGRRVSRLLALEGKPWRLLPSWWLGAAHCAGALCVAALLLSSAAIAHGGNVSLTQRLWLLASSAVAQPEPATAEPEGYQTRTYRVDPSTFERSLREFLPGREPATVVEDLAFLLQSLGVDVAPPFQSFYNARNGMWMVRARAGDIDDIEKLMQTLNATRPQLVIEAKFVELSERLETLDLENLVIGGQAGTNQNFQGILPPARYRDLIKQFETQKGVDILAAPRITTLSGRQAQIKIVDIRHIVTDLDYSGDATNTAPRPVAEPFELGPVLDVIPTVRPDGVSIELNLISTVREFIGYDMPPRYIDSGTPTPLTPKPIRDYLRQADGAAAGRAPEPAETVIPLPRFRLRQAQTSTCLWDGQTAVMALEVIFPSGTKTNLQYAASGKPCLLFVTSTLIDPTGNRVHQEADLPYAENSVPPK